MARLLDRFRRRPAEGAGEEASAQAPPPAPARRLPPPGALRRERRALVRTREERIRDLGGLMLEMYRRDRFRQDLLVEQCLEVIAVEERLRELDSLLAASLSARRQGSGVRCTCGAPILWGSHFCANCGRPVGEEPVVSCPNCGAPLPAEARFCASCGTPIPETAQRGDGQSGESDRTVLQSASGGDQRESSSDPWEE